MTADRPRRARPTRPPSNDSGQQDQPQNESGDAPQFDEFLEDMRLSKLSWSYRRMLTPQGAVEIREVYTRIADGTVAGWTTTSPRLSGADEDDLADLIEKTALALREPVLVEVDLPGYKPDAP